MKEINKFIQETKNNLFYNWSVNDVLAVCAASRAQVGFSFIGRCLDLPPQGTLRYEATSPPYSRQMDVLISYNFELLLDAGFFASEPELKEKELLNKVKGKHSLETKWNNITNPEIKSLFEIKSVITKRNGIFKYYSITLNNGEELKIEDHIEIRFDVKDFRNKMPRELRLVISKPDLMDSVVEFSGSVSKKVIDYLCSKYKK